MKISKTLILLLLVVSMMLPACGATPADEPQQTVPATEATEPEAVVEETEPPVEKPAFVEKLHYQPELSETVLPEKNTATGTLMFYLNDQTVYAGGPVATLLEVSAYSDTDMSTIIQPWHMSGAIRVQVELEIAKDPEDKDSVAQDADNKATSNKDDAENTASTKEAFVFFVAMNASDEPKMISECLIYSLTVNYEDDIRFGTGKETEPFVTGTTTLEEILEAYGEPSYIDSRKEKYQELFYYQPFSCVSFLCKNGEVKQVNSYYSANVYGALAKELSLELTGTPMENDALILMAQYLDVTPYLPEKVMEEEDTGEKKAEEKTSEEKTEDTEEKKASLSSFDPSFVLDGNTIQFGSKVSDLPSPFKEGLNELLMPINWNFYVRTGRHEPEEFFLINAEGQREMKSNDLLVKGVIVENQNYLNWGIDNSAFHSFNCQGITEDTTIDEILTLLGQPGEMIFSSGERLCFVWMHYETEAGDYIHIRVDPLLNQVIEVHMVKHFEKERKY